MSPHPQKRYSPISGHVGFGLLTGLLVSSLGGPGSLKSTGMWASERKDPLCGQQDFHPEFDLLYHRVGAGHLPALVSWGAPLV